MYFPMGEFTSIWEQCSVSLDFWSFKSYVNLCNIPVKCYDVFNGCVIFAYDSNYLLFPPSFSYRTLEVWNKDCIKLLSSVLYTFSGNTIKKPIIITFRDTCLGSPDRGPYIPDMGSMGSHDHQMAPPMGGGVAGACYQVVLLFYCYVIIGSYHVIWVMICKVYNVNWNGS